ncbi:MULTISPECIES: PilZ domain-containing protein [unclassified Rhizobium]|uniref:PilZ domain-containing protein n=1 Tax=unclassified Rhizobium TaxID=2613769 RepID=UPI00135A979B|nr:MULTISPECIES: PilZ domain-containing protein [unclassified Rhizobium]
MTTIEAVQEERRSFPRWKTLKAVRILFHSGASSFDGIVRNMSEGGAKVILESSIGLPDDIELVFEDGTKKSAKVVRRGLTEIGVAFVSLPGK